MLLGEVERAKLADLLAACAEYGLSTSGNRFALVVRVAHFLMNGPEASVAAAPVVAASPITVSTGVQTEVDELAPVPPGQAHAGVEDRDVDRVIGKLDAEQKRLAVCEFMLKNQPQMFARWLSSAVRWSLEQGHHPEHRQPRIPAGATSKCWQHFYLLDGFPGHVFCKHCCPPESLEVHWSAAGKLKREKTSSTRNLLNHLVDHHGMVKTDLTGKGEGSSCGSGVELQKSAEPYASKVLEQIYTRLILGAVVVDLQPFSIFEREGLAAGLLSVNPRVPPPSRKVCKKVVQDAVQTASLKAKEFLKVNFSSTSPQTALMSIEIDFWPSPNHGSFFGVFLHGLTRDFEMVQLLAHCAPFGKVPHTSQNIGQRCLSVVKGFADQQFEDTVWLIMSDNASDCSAVASALNVVSGRCGAHIIALAPVHLLFPVKRVVQGVASLQMHERAQANVYKMACKARALSKLFMRRFGKDVNAGLLEASQRRLGEPVLGMILDSSSKWSSSFAMLQRHYQVRRSMLEVAQSHGHKFPERTFFTEADYAFMNHIVGILRPLKDATNLLQVSAFAGSSFLPIMATLEQQLSPEVPVRVGAGAVDAKKTMLVKESQLFSEARQFRQALSKEFETVRRHIAPCRLVMSMASFSDPRFKHLPWLQTEEEKAEVRAAFLQEVVRMQESSQSAVPVARSRAAPGGMAIKTPRKVRRIDSDTIRFAEALSTQASPMQEEGSLQSLVQQSIDCYLAEPALAAFDDPLAWWKETGKQKFPYLCQAARKFLGTTGSSAKVERLWSSGRYLLEYFRSSLDGGLAGNILQLRENMRLLGLWEENTEDPDDSEDEADDWVEGPILDLEH
jgi:hypothetical protein